MDLATEIRSEQAVAEVIVGEPTNVLAVCPERVRVELDDHRTTRTQ